MLLLFLSCMPVVSSVRLLLWFALARAAWFLSPNPVPFLQSGIHLNILLLILLCLLLILLCLLLILLCLLLILLCLLLIFYLNILLLVLLCLLHTHKMNTHPHVPSNYLYHARKHTHTNTHARTHTHARCRDPLLALAVSLVPGNGRSIDKGGGHGMRQAETRRSLHARRQSQLHPSKRSCASALHKRLHHSHNTQQAPHHQRSSWCRRG